MDPESIEDRISFMPDDIIQDILVRLPILDAVRTCLLSRRWRYKWISIPQLVFDEMNFPPSYRKITMVEHEYIKLTKFVSQTLFLHRGPITMFKLSTSLSRCPGIDQLIHFVIRNGVKKLVIQDFPFVHKRYNLPPGFFFHFDTVVHLELNFCSLKIPSDVGSLGSLTNLIIQGGNFINGEMERLISNCPRLRKLVLTSHHDVHLKIVAPKLHELKVFGSFFRLHLENTPKLAFVVVSNSSLGKVGSFPHERTCSLMDFFSGLVSIERLVICDVFLQSLSGSNTPTPKRLPTTYDCLKDVCLHVHFGDLKQMMTALCLFRSFPALEKLSIFAHPMKTNTTTTIVNIWEAKEPLCCRFNCLRTMVMENMLGTESELGFIGFVLANAPNLIVIRIQLSRTIFKNIKKVADICKHLMSFPRASTQAKILFIDGWSLLSFMQSVLD